MFQIVLSPCVLGCISPPPQKSVIATPIWPFSNRKRIFQIQFSPCPYAFHPFLPHSLNSIPEFARLSATFCGYLSVVPTATPKPSRICSAALIWARTLAPTWNNDRNSKPAPILIMQAGHLSSPFRISLPSKGFHLGTCRVSQCFTPQMRKLQMFPGCGYLPTRAWSSCWNWGISWGPMSGLMLIWPTKIRMNHRTLEYICMYI